MDELKVLNWRFAGAYRRGVSRFCGRRPFRMRNRHPIISFTFDDFPRSAVLVGGRILEDFGTSATYYTSFGLMGKVAPTGEAFTRDDLSLVIQGGHEFGCHTFDHCHAYDTSATVFEHSIVKNRRALHTLIPEVCFKTLAYPISVPRPGTKKCSANYFLGCRAGGQTCNSGTTDLNALKAFFIEQSRDNLGAIKSMIDATCAAGGWLIFATHDVSDTPTRYGCSPGQFQEIVRHSVRSGARLLSVSAALADMAVPMCEHS